MGLASKDTFAHVMETFPLLETLLPEAKGIKAVYFRTGSVEFGVDLDSSDTDYIVIPTADWTRLYDFLNRHPRRIESGVFSQMESTKLALAGGEIDLIMKDIDDAAAWFYATQTMKTLPKEWMLQKNRRVQLFEDLVSAFKTAERK